MRVTLSIISDNTWKDIFTDQPLDKSTVKLKAYTGEVYLGPEECGC